ncbi:MaoC family dehydratase [uncultured Amaricoccus sp.]|uniref:MaoC family dehydratase n=1 Tax=uncultured Amaricoccus sp. TaxID=339341 RepID=UPI00260FC269|nr:MaoC family dehydratase [uncultured Amaricoccus sp.]
MTRVEIIDGKPVIRVPERRRSTFDQQMKSGNLIEVGDTATYRRTVTEADVALFSGATGDVNPYHFDEIYASRGMFKKRIAHGMLVTGYISTVLGTIFPGPGTIYLSQTLEFRAPVFIGDTITAVVEVLAIKETKPILTLRTDCINQDGKTVVEGRAVVLFEYVPMEPETQGA